MRYTKTTQKKLYKNITDEEALLFTEISIEVDGIEEIPEFVRKSTNLKTLKLYSCKISQLTEWLTELPFLETLEIYCCVMEIPELLLRLPCLTEFVFSLSYDDVKIPVWINQLHLKRLGLPDNYLDSLEALRGLNTLEKLDVSSNLKLCSLTGIEQLPKLKTVNAKYTRITYEHVSELFGERVKIPRITL